MPGQYGNTIIFTLTIQTVINKVLYFWSDSIVHYMAPVHPVKSHMCCVVPCHFLPRGHGYPHPCFLCIYSVNFPVHQLSSPLSPSSQWARRGSPTSFRRFTYKTLPNTCCLPLSVRHSVVDPFHPLSVRHSVVDPFHPALRSSCMCETTYALLEVWSQRRLVSKPLSRYSVPLDITLQFTRQVNTTETRRRSLRIYSHYFGFCRKPRERLSHLI